MRYTILEKYSSSSALWIVQGFRTHFCSTLLHRLFKGSPRGTYKEPLKVLDKKF